MSTDKEKIYDERIAPLMHQILVICHEHKIAMIADFALDDVDFHCTSATLDPDYSPLPNQLKAFAYLKPQPATALAITETTLPNGDKNISIKRLR